MIHISRCSGSAIAPYLHHLAQLRIAVFREYPYLYDGDSDYELRYLASYAASALSVFVLARDGEKIVGAATGIPLADDAPPFHAPFRERGIDPRTVFYFGESVLLPGYRGQGIGHCFFDEREQHAREHVASGQATFTQTAFAAVDRADDDPRKPASHRGNEAFWRKRGYQRQPGMTMHLPWKELGETCESEKPLTFWLRPLDPAKRHQY